MEQTRYHAIPRFLVWAGLAVFTLYSGIRLAAGPGRDTTFEAVTWTGGAIAQVLVVTGVLAALFARAAWITYRTEIVAPPAGTLVIRGARMNFFGETFLTLVGGLLLLATVYLALRIPETLLASSHPRYAHYHSASVTPNLMIGAVFGGCGFLLLIVRRYLWVFAPGKPIVRFWARTFSRGRTTRAPLELYWTYFYVKRGYVPVPVAHWLRARDPSSAGSFRDCDLELVPLTMTPDELQQFKKIVGATDADLVSLNTPPEKLRAIEQAWQQRFAQVTGVVPAVVAEERQPLAMTPQPA